MPTASHRGRSGGSGIPPLAARILRLVASETAVTRTGLATELATAPSTISSAVGLLIDLGLVAEEGAQASTGGRPRRVLRLGRKDDFAIAADLGAHHARVGVILPGGDLEYAENVPFAMDDGPESSVPALLEAFDRLADQHGSELWRSVGLSIPGPVNSTDGTVELPSRMPGWNRFPIGPWIEDRIGRPVVVDNDANCMTVAEYTQAPSGTRQMIFVKAGSAIGAGIMIDGTLYRGATGVAGDITHVRISAGGDRPCSCGNTGCLETVASGLALVRMLRENGREVDGVQDVVQLALQADPVATRAVRQAGQHLGEVLAANVNFFNPDAIYLGGVLSTTETFVAAVRSQLYQDCHPLVTRRLTIGHASLGEDAGIIGAGKAALEHAALKAIESINHTPTGSRNHAHAR